MKKIIACLMLSALVLTGCEEKEKETKPEKIDYRIIATEPAVKGNTATNATKDATIETGLVVKVPLFINQGERIIVSTSDGKYSGRA